MSRAGTSGATIAVATIAGGSEFCTPGIPVARDTVNSAVPIHTTTTIAEPSHHGIDRHRSITMPSTIPMPTAANFQGIPGDGAGYVTKCDTQKWNTGDRVVPGGHR